MEMGAAALGREGCVYAPDGDIGGRVTESTVRCCGWRLKVTVNGAAGGDAGADDVDGALGTGPVATGVSGRKLVGRLSGTRDGGAASVTGTTLTNANPGNCRAGGLLVGGGGDEGGMCALSAETFGFTGRKLNDVKRDGALGNLGGGWLAAGGLRGASS